MKPKKLELGRKPTCKLGDLAIARQDDGMHERDSTCPCKGMPVKRYDWEHGNQHVP